MNWLPRCAVFGADSMNPLHQDEPGWVGRVLIISWLGIVIGFHRHV
ncbi:MAG: hypothetical protein K2X76_05095 [Sphingomonas sp.]|nr:hypothetical protein [Sphingomonas sp.]